MKIQHQYRNKHLIEKLFFLFSDKKCHIDNFIDPAQCLNTNLLKADFSSGLIYPATETFA